MANINDKIKRLNSLIPDENLRTIIFNHDNRYNSFLEDDKECIKYFSNTLIFITYFIYRVFLKWKKDNDIDVSSFPNSMIRIYNLLNDCYKEKKISFDYIEDLVINLQIDLSMKQNGFLKTLGLDHLFSFKTNFLSKSIYMLKKSRISSRYISTFNFDDLCEFFGMLPLLYKAKVDFIDYTELIDKRKFRKINISFYDKPAEKICLEQLLLVSKSSCLYLEEITFNDIKEFDNKGQKEQSLIANYLYFAGETTYKVAYINRNYLEFDEKYGIVCNDTAIESLMIFLGILNFESIKEKSYFFQDYVFFNNQYIKTIALVISDTISSRTKEEILSKYRHDYADVFEKLSVNTLNGCKIFRWDEIIIFLLLEEGIYSFLKVILSREYYDELIDNFVLRFGDRAKKIINKNETIANPLINIEYKNVENERKSMAKAIINLATKLLSVNDISLVNDYSAASICDIILDFNRIYSSRTRSDYDKISYFINRIINVTLFLDSFYNGLLEYVANKRIVELSLENLCYDDYQHYLNSKKSYLNSFTRTSNEIKRKSQHLLKNSLKLKSYQEDYFDIIQKDIVDSFDLLIATNEAVSKRNSYKNEQLFEVIGKRKIFDSSNIINCKNKLIDAINKCKNLGNNTVAMINELYYASIFYLEYLRKGSFNHDGHIEDSIYPIIASCANGVISRDGYRYSYMYVNNGNKDSQAKIKVVSDDEFVFGEFYYCIPNINRIANIKINNYDERIWISPIIIPYNLHPQNTLATFVKLENEEDYETIAELIYYTDKKIYKDLFGSLDNAKKVLPHLFDKSTNGKKSIFNKDYIYMLKISDENNPNGKVIAVATCYNNLPEWSPSLVESAFEDAGVELPSTIKDAFIYFKDTFEEFTGNNKSIICDLCVKKEYRNAGFGKLMLNNLIKKAYKEGRDLLITVYEDNYIAFNLYNLLGFIPYISDYDTRGKEKDNQEKYYKMIKFI